ncbi:MAG: hypothetical protein IT556_07485 [Acetobacteraceae bacterium]|nr:hypothetical protein [Acetobacteraceae bacterium]
MRGTFLVALLAAAAGSGCTAMNDPWERDGAWRPTRANDANLRAMVADQADLVAGRGSDRRVGPGAADAVDRLYRDRVRPLPVTDIARIGASSASPAAPGGGEGGGGGIGGGGR